MSLVDHYIDVVHLQRIKSRICKCYIPESKIMSTTLHKPDEASVISKALLAAGEALGLSREQLGRVVGRDRSRLRDGLRPDSKPAELALLLIRVYRSLYALVDGDVAVMRHWMHTYNHGTGGIPAEQVQSAQGLVAVVDYLDAIRAKV